MNAPDNEVMLEAIERDEAWLRDAMGRFPTPAPRSLEHLKLRLRMAVDEQVLDMDSGAAPSAKLLAQVKDSIREEISRQAVPVETAGDRFRTLRLTFAGLAAAAVLAFAVIPALIDLQNSERTQVAQRVDPIDDFVAVLASDPSDTETELLRLDSELEELENTFTAVDDPWFDDELDDIEDDIDRLLIEHDDDAFLDI